MPKQEEQFVTAEVQGVNDKGVKVNGEWFNYSKFAKDLPDVEKGDRVTLRLQGDFIMGIKVAGQADASPRPTGGRDWPDAGQREFEGAMERQGQPGHSDKDRLIARHVALKGAIDYCDRDSAVDDVLNVADQFYGWLLAAR